MEASCPFHLLGLDRHASMQEVTRAWRHSMLLAHPDKGGDACLMLAQRLNEAKEDALVLARDNRDPKPQALLLALHRQTSAPTQAQEDLLALLNQKRRLKKRPRCFALSIRPLEGLTSAMERQQTLRWNEWAQSVRAPDRGWRLPTSLGGGGGGVPPL
jgi:hypothetical protein